MLRYDAGTGDLENWIVEETAFDPAYSGKCESIMALGNGYMGVRSATEESYVSQKRDTLICGTFNRFSEKEVTELPNIPDATEIEFTFDGLRFTLEQGRTLAYSRRLNIKTALLTREIVWMHPNGKEITLSFLRFVSLANRHALCSQVRLSCPQGVDVTVRSGINGQVTNTGSQHFDEDDMRFFDKKYLQYNAVTTQRKILVSVNTTHRLSVPSTSQMHMDRRQIMQIFRFAVPPEGTVILDKLSWITASIDAEQMGKTPAELKAAAHESLRGIDGPGFDQLLKEHAACWQKEIWDHYTFSIHSQQPQDELALRFAVYHLTGMTPGHDHQCGIGAKGLTGEGYKGHSFWDTEIFILPFYIYTNPAIARSLLEYRYLGLEGARKKARDNGCKGAMYPWEAAWPDDGEVTPVWGAVDVVTGEQTKIWSGFIELHITCDVALAVWQYYMITGDQDFMDRYGYEMLFETAAFWASRYEWDEGKNRYGINDVIGPDEYKEHANNNAYTNHMSAHNLRLALRYYADIRANRPEVFTRLNHRLKLDEQRGIWEERLAKIYLPMPNEDRIIPQDDGYLTYPAIDLSAYKQNAEVGALFRDYNLETVNHLQASKQADVLMLLYQMENLFPPEIKKVNFDYYESKTLHDSSLSLSTHSILAGDLGDREMAYSLFRRACGIDLGPNMKTSDMGVHAASLGGIWQCVVMGFGGLRMLDGKLRIDPRLPAEWTELRFPFYWQGKRISAQVTQHMLRLRSDDGNPVEFFTGGKLYTLTRDIDIEI